MLTETKRALTSLMKASVEYGRSDRPIDEIDDSLTPLVERVEEALMEDFVNLQKKAVNIRRCC